MIKRFTLIIGIVLSALASVPRTFADDQIIQPIGPFGTLNNTDNSMTISADKSQDMLNVEITPGGKSVKKRRGYASAFSLSIASGPVHGDYLFYDSNGNDVALFFNDNYLSASVNGGAASVVKSSGSTNGATWQCTDSQGSAYCLNSNRSGGILKTNGVTFSYISVTSTGTTTTVTPDRLVTAGFSDAPNRVDFSKANDFTTWTPGINATDPVTFTITSPGSHITMMAYAFGKVLVFKDSSFVQIIEGNQANFADWSIQTVSQSVGTLDNSFVYWQDVFYFRGQDGHYYAFDGSNLIKLSRDIQTTISQSQSKRTNSWTQSSGTDFGAGSLTNIDSTTVSGQLTLTYLPAYETRPYYGFDQNLTLSTEACTASNYLAQSFTATTTYKVTSVGMDFAKTGSPGNFQLTLRNDSSSTPTGSIIDTAIVYSTAVTASFPSATTISSTLPTQPTIANGTRYWIQLIPLGTCNTSNRISWYRYPIPSGVMDDPTSQFGVAGSSSSTSNYYRFDINGSTYASSGTFLSQVKSASSLTSWDTFTANKADVDGSHTFSIRASTGSFTLNSSTPSWTAVSPGAIPTISTGTSFQIRDVIATNISTTTPILYDFTQNWFEGSAADKAYASYFKDAIWWSVASGTSTTTNNKIHRFDLLNRGWTIYDIPTNGLYVRSQSLYFGGVTAGTIFKFGDVDQDNGTAINAYWKSKDFFGDSPFTDKEIRNVSVSAASIANSSMTVTYTLNGSSSTVYTMPCYTSNSSFTKYGKNAPLGRQGGTFNIQFGNNATDQPFEVFAAQVGFVPKSWKPSQ